MFPEQELKKLRKSTIVKRRKAWRDWHEHKRIAEDYQGKYWGLHGDTERISVTLGEIRGKGCIALTEKPSPYGNRYLCKCKRDIHYSLKEMYMKHCASCRLAGNPEAIKKKIVFKGVFEK